MPTNVTFRPLPMKYPRTLKNMQAYNNAAVNWIFDKLLMPT